MGLGCDRAAAIWVLACLCAAAGRVWDLLNHCLSLHGWVRHMKDLEQQLLKGNNMFVDKDLCLSLISRRDQSLNSGLCARSPYAILL